MKKGLNQINAFVINSQCGETVPLTATATSTNVAFALAASARNYDVVVCNTGDKVAFVAFGIGSATAAQLPGTSGTANATPVPAGAIMTFQKNTDALANDTCAAICNTGETTTLYFTSVQGS